MNDHHQQNPYARHSARRMSKDFRVAARDRAIQPGYFARFMILPLSNADRRELKARAQHLEPAVRLGREGASEGFYRALDEALSRHGLVKVKFAEHKEEKKVLAGEIATQSGSELVMRVGNVAVYFRPRAEVASGEE